MKTRILSILLAILMIAAAFALSSCGWLTPNEPTDPPTKSSIEQVYDLYVDYAKSNGEVPESYDDWLKTVTGPKGEDGVSPTIGYNGNWWIGNTDTGVSAIGKDGANGKDGVGIEKIEKISSEGLVDTYEITYTSGTKITFTLTNGADGEKGENGADGVGIVSIDKISSEGLVDTYEIKYTDGSSTTFTVTNGASGESGGSAASCNHEFSEWVVVYEPSCESIGVSYRTCSGCGEIEYDYPNKLGHTLVDVYTIVDTCEEHTVLQKCTVCNSLHMIDLPTSHNLVIDEAVPATCYSTGLTDGCHCSKCGEIIVYQQTTSIISHKYVDGICTMCGIDLNSYTYNTYLSSMPTSWNPHTYQTATDYAVLEYTTVGLYGYDYNEARDGFVVVPEMAAAMPVDVTADFAGAGWDIDESDTSRAWLIELRDDLAWEDGTPITAYDFVESVRRLLEPGANNYRADQLYSGDLSLVGAVNYFRGGRVVKLPANEVFGSYSEDIADQLIFTLGPGDVECYVRTWAGLPASYDVYNTADYLIGNYGSYMTLSDGNNYFTPKAAEAMEGKTIAEIKADPELAAAWESACRFAMALAGTELVWCTVSSEYPEYSFDSVGIKALSDTELVIILESPLDGFYLYSSLMTDLGLVHLPTYDACASYDENGVYTNTYGTSVDTTMSFGPYKLVAFDYNNQIVLERNDQWYGYSDPAYVGQYQTTRVVFDYYENNDTALNAFLRGELDVTDLDVNNISDYTASDRIYYTDGASTWFIALNPNEEAFAKWEAKNPGYDKSILTIKEFRMALSFSLNRQEFINSLDPMGSIGLALFNNMICSDPENGIMYRTEEAAKDAILEFWGISQNDIGIGKLYATKDEAIASITGYNLDGAKELFNQAYDAAVAAGIYNGTDKIQICVGIPSQAGFYTRGFEFLKNNYTEAVKGTKLEGKLEFTTDNTIGNGFADALRANKVDMLFGVGWRGSALNPYGLIGAYTNEDYQYDPAWDTSEAMMQFTIDGVVYEASVLDWTYAIEGMTVQIRNTKTGTLVKYSCGSADVKKDPAKQEERVRLLAALENAVLQNYDMIPTHNQTSASLLSYQVNYGSEKYVYGIGFGGVKYMTYAYSDADWNTFVKMHGDNLDYNRTHSLEKTVVDPTCTSNGYTEYTCSCGCSFIGDEITSDEYHNFVDNVCSYCGIILDDYFVYTELPDGTYEVSVFDNKNLPKTVVIPSEFNGKAVTRIATGAFSGLSEIYQFDGAFCEVEYITIPSTITSIGDCAFASCAYLKEIEIPDSVTSMGHGVFFYCASLESVKLSANTPEIPFATFGYCMNLNNVVIPYGVTKIDSYAFAYCMNLDTITIPGSVEEIIYAAFIVCNFSELEIPEGTKYLGAYLFVSTPIKKLILPKSLTTIDGMFYDNLTVEEIIYNGTKSDWENINITEYDIEYLKYLSITINCTDGVYEYKDIEDPVTPDEPTDLDYQTSIESFSADTKVTITFYHTMGSYFRDVLDEYIAEFNKLYPNITVKHEQIGGYDDVFSQIRTQLNVGISPNIAYCYPHHVATYDLVNAVVTLDQFIDSTVTIERADGSVEVIGLTDSQKAAFFGALFGEGSAYGDGYTYTMPMSKSVEVLYYNKSFFEEHNLKVPTTWEEMEEVCRQIKAIDPNCIPLGYDSEANWFINLALQCGGDYTSATGEHYLFDNETNREFIKMLREWYQDGLITTQEILGSYTSELFTKSQYDGTTAYMVISSSAGAKHHRPYMVNGEYPFEVGIAPLPQVDPSNPKAYTNGPSLCLFGGENISGAEAVASWLFIKFLTTNPEFQAAFSMASGYMPVTEAALEVPEYVEYLNNADNLDHISALANKVAIEQADAYVYVPAFVGCDEARYQVGNILISALCGSPSGGESVDAFIKRLFETAIRECNYN